MNLNYLLVFGIILFLRFYGENNDLYTALGLIVIFFVMRNITEGIVADVEESEEKTMVIHEEDPRLINISELLDNLDQDAINKLHENGLNEAQFKFFTDYLSSKNLTTLDQIYNIDTINFNVGNFKTVYYTKNPQQSMTTDQVNEVFSYIKNNPETFITIDFLLKYIRERYGRVLDLQGGDIPEEINSYMNLLINKFRGLSKGELIGFYNVIKTNGEGASQKLSGKLMRKLIQPKQIPFEYSRIMFQTFILLIISFFNNFLSGLSISPDISDDIYQYVQTYITTYCSGNHTDTRCVEAGIPSPSPPHNQYSSASPERVYGAMDNQYSSPSPENPSSTTEMVVAPGVFGVESPDKKCTEYTCLDGKKLKSNLGDTTQGSSPQQKCCENTTAEDPDKCTEYTCPPGKKLKSNLGDTTQGSSPEQKCCENGCASPLNYFAGSSPNCICSPLPVASEADEETRNKAIRNGFDLTIFGWTPFCYEGEYWWVWPTLIAIGFIGIGALWKLSGGKQEKKKYVSMRESLEGVAKRQQMPSLNFTVDNSKKVDNSPITDPH